jgi:hypothetical protein
MSAEPRRRGNKKILICFLQLSRRVLKSGLPVSSVAQGSHLQLTDAISFQLPEAKVGVRFFCDMKKRNTFFAEVSLNGRVARLGEF